MPCSESIYVQHGLLKTINACTIVNKIDVGSAEDGALDGCGYHVQYKIRTMRDYRCNMIFTHKYT